jgi:hypothetical protein
MLNSRMERSCERSTNSASIERTQIGIIKTDWTEFSTAFDFMKKTNKNNNGPSPEAVADKHLTAVCTCCSVATKLQDIINGRRESSKEYADHPEVPDVFILANAVHNWILNNETCTSEFVRHLIANDEHLFYLMLKQKEGK